MKMVKTKDTKAFVVTVVYDDVVTGKSTDKENPEWLDYVVFAQDVCEASQKVELAVGEETFIRIESVQWADMIPVF